MDRTIHAATAEQRGIRGVDDGVDLQRRDVGANGTQCGCHVLDLRESAS
jgi:hypothetical protein